MFKIKAYHVNPINVVCLTLLVCVLLVSIMSYTRADKAQLPVRDEVSKNTYTIKLVTDNSNKQMGMDAILYDGDRQVDVIHMDSTCQLAKAILLDNQ